METPDSTNSDQVELLRMDMVQQCLYYLVVLKSQITKFSSIRLSSANLCCEILVVCISQAHHVPAFERHDSQSPSEKTFADRHQRRGGSIDFLLW